MSLIVISLFVLLYNRIFAVTFDESFSHAVGLRTGLYNLLMAVIIAIIIVLAMNLVGSLLISALVIFPALSAMRICKSFKSVTLTAAAVSVICAGGGIIASILFSAPVGATIVVADILAFFICCAVGLVKKRE